MLVIRKMRKNDLGSVQDVAHKSWHATYERIIPPKIQENFLNVAYSDEMMEKRMQQSLLMVAESEQGIIGFANYSNVNEKGDAELGAIYLYPEQQGKGIGSALLKEGINRLEGVKAIYIDVEKENEIGRSFYEAKGFKAVKEFDDNFDGHILKTLRMVLEV